MNEEVVIVIPGSKYIKPRAKIIRQLIMLFYRLTRIFKPVSNSYVVKWKHNFNKRIKKVCSGKYKGMKNHRPRINDDVISLP